MCRHMVRPELTDKPGPLAPDAATALERVGKTIENDVKARENLNSKMASTIGGRGVTEEQAEEAGSRSPEGHLLGPSPTEGLGRSDSGGDRDFQESGQEGECHHCGGGGGQTLRVDRSEVGLEGHQGEIRTGFLTEDQKGILQSRAEDYIKCRQRSYGRVLWQEQRCGVDGSLLSDGQQTGGDLLEQRPECYSHWSSCHRPQQKERS